jgi:hypothetical protein
VTAAASDTRQTLTSRSVILPDDVHVPAPREDVEHPLARHFESMREARREQRASSGGKRRAVLTIVRDEPVFFPIWLRYYSRFFGPEDIYVLDHETCDGSTDGEGFVRIPVTHDTVDHTWMVRTIEEHQHRLLEDYDLVLVSDVDEIVVPSPEVGGLDVYLDDFQEIYVNCLGYELIHMVDREGPFDPAEKVLDQRGYWFANQIYDKPAVASMPMRWAPGFHHTEKVRLRPDPDLRLVHLHRMDYEICLERHRYRDRARWNELDVGAGWASHNRITDDVEFARWFYEETGFPLIDLLVEPIPPSWRGLF